MGTIPNKVAILLDDAMDKVFRSGGLPSGALGQSFSGILNDAISGGTGGVHFNPQAGTSYVVTAADNIIGMSDAAVRTVTLPNSATAGTVYTIKDTSGTATTGNTITISVATSGTIDGASTYVITPGTNTGVSVVSDGTNYWIIAKV